MMVEYTQILSLHSSALGSCVPLHWVLASDGQENTKHGHFPSFLGSETIDHFMGRDITSLGPRQVLLASTGTATGGRTMG